MSDFESTVRISAFVAIFGLVATWEALQPRRPQAVSRRRRWPHNLGLLAIDVVLLRLVAPGAALAVAIAAEAGNWGLLHAHELPKWLAAAAGIVLLDLAIYCQHVMFHAVPTLWRMHRVHHSDPEFDVTTGIRFHPFEILLSTGVKCAAVAAIGAPVVAVFVFEVLLNATSMFNHANARMPARLDRFLRWVIVTPDMHRVHHSVRYEESSSNFGFSLPWWDRLFGTYRAVPESGHVGMTIGVDAFRAPEELSLGHLLSQPFRDTAGQYPINRRQSSG